MADLNPNNFIAPYQNDDFAISLQDSKGNILRSFHIGAYLSCNTEGKTMYLLLEGNTNIPFAFSSIVHATIAAASLRSAINNLLPNLSGTTSSTTPIAAPVSITLINYLELANTSSLVELQWYDVTDATNLLGYGAGQTFRVLALTTDDRFPQGIVLGATYYNNKVVLDLENNKVSFLNNIEEKTLKLFNSDINITNSTDILAINSTGGISGSSNLYITNSDANIINSTGVNLFNSNVTLNNATNAIIENISGDLSTLVLSDVFVNNSSTEGKSGKVNLNLTGNSTLLAYIDKIVQVAAGVLTQNVEISLKNGITQANSKFLIAIDSSFNFNGYKITIKDDNTTNTIKEIKVGSQGKVFEFMYNISEAKYFLLGTQSSLITKTELSIISDNQVSFPSSLSFIPLSLTETQLFVNGIKYTYGIAEDYYITSTNLTWTGNKFKLETTDNVEIYYW
jgi:hypothetical protein